MQTVNVRQPQTVHLDGGVRLRRNCTSQRLGNLVSTDCDQAGPARPRSVRARRQDRGQPKPDWRAAAPSPRFSLCSGGDARPRVQSGQRSALPSAIASTGPSSAARRTVPRSRSTSDSGHVPLGHGQRERVGQRHGEHLALSPASAAVSSRSPTR
jgi:hypothetical protein